MFQDRVMFIFGNPLSFLYLSSRFVSLNIYRDSEGSSCSAEDRSPVS